MFCVSSHRVATGAAPAVLQEGDFILVNRMHGASNPGRNRVVLFSSPLRKDLVAPPLLLSRCVGMPGDTVQITPEGFAINGRVMQTADSKVFRIHKNVRQALVETLQRLDIPLRSVAEDSLTIAIRLTGKEALLLRDSLPSILVVPDSVAGAWQRSLVVPFCGYEYRPDSASLFLYADAIVRESQGRIALVGHTLRAGGQVIASYRFRHDHYWMLSDSNEAVDSRHLGFVPRNCIAGNVWICWFSTRKTPLFTPIR